jgi:hypothetical protein
MEMSITFLYFCRLPLLQMSSDAISNAPDYNLYQVSIVNCKLNYGPTTPC